MYFKRFMEALTECEIEMHEAQLECMSIHPYELISDKETVLQEAFDLKGTAESAFNKAVQVFINLCETFKKAAFKLKQKNVKWFESASRFDLARVDLKDFNYEMFDYKTGLERIKSKPLPIFNSSGDMVNDLSGDSRVFKEKSFKEIYFPEGNIEGDIDKNYFRGSNEKLPIKSHEVTGLYTFALNWLKQYENTVNAIYKDSENINSILRSEKASNKTVVTESTILLESLFKDEYYDILLEDALNPKDIEQEEKNKINPNNKEITENKEKNIKLDSVQKYWKICSTIQTMKIDVCREAYAEFTKFIDKVMDCPTKK